MSRRHAAEKREVLPDAKFGDIVLTKFMNNLMIDGKKAVAERIVYNAFDRVESKLKKSPVEVFHEALEQHQTSRRSAFAPRRWCDLSGACRSAPRASRSTGYPLVDQSELRSQRKHHGRASCR